MRTILVFAMLTFATVSHAEPTKPLKKGVVKAGKGWHCTRGNQLPDVTMCDRNKRMCDAYVQGSRPDEYGKCFKQATAVCVTFRVVATKKYDAWCHETAKSCEKHRTFYLTDDYEPADDVSDCVVVK